MTDVKIIRNDESDLEVAVSGMLDTAAVADFSSNFEPVIKEAHKHVELDFSGLDYISSSGLRVLLVLAKQAASSGGSVCIKGMNPDVRQVFCLTGFDKVFAIV